MKFNSSKLRSTKLRLIVLVIALFALSGIVTAQAAVADTNLATCVADGQYDENTDYFPEKAELTHAETFSIEYHNNYKVVTVNTPWFGATEDDAYQYVLV
ncbi:MAG TPA: hypothetical protein VHL11_13895, partial [Phototrophicaceae bacterium]|nr:hypothetical protein [Phototrophicaceae bacterium]